MFPKLRKELGHPGNGTSPKTLWCVVGLEDDGRSTAHPSQRLEGRLGRTGSCHRLSTGLLAVGRVMNKTRMRLAQAIPPHTEGTVWGIWV